jgi:hypothetical protein
MKLKFMVSLLHVQDLDEAEQILSGLGTQYATMDLQVNPLVFSLPNTTIVAFDSKRLLADSLVKGIDLCFKLITVFNLPLVLNIENYEITSVIKQIQFSCTVVVSYQ